MINLGLFRHAETLPVSAGTMLFEAGEVGDRMYVVIEGEVEILVGSFVAETVQEGSIFGEMALIDQSPRSASARAKTDCRVAVVDLKRFEFLVQNTPYFSIQVMKVMADRLRNGNSQLQNARTAGLHST